MARAAASKTQTRIQKEKTEAILTAALEVFSTFGFRGSTIDQIAEAAGLSKPNLLYYFDNKDAMHAALINRLLETWLTPLQDLNEKGDPLEEITGYVMRKLEMSRDYPRESRLFANEILQGGPRILVQIQGHLKNLVDEKAAIIKGWSNEGMINDVDPYHLIFSIWATTQHYADFDVQVSTIINQSKEHTFEGAKKHLCQMFTRLLRPSEG